MKRILQLSFLSLFLMMLGSCADERYVPRVEVFYEWDQNIFGTTLVDVEVVNDGFGPVRKVTIKVDLYDPDGFLTATDYFTLREYMEPGQFHVMRCKFRDVPFPDWVEVTVMNVD
jgi:hypothetical protein